MRKIVAFFFFVTLALASGSVQAQSYQYVLDNPGLYIVGEGRGATVEAADNAALANIVSQVAVNVQVDNNISRNSRRANGQVVSDNTLFSSTIHTSSGLALVNTERIVKSYEPEVHVVRWIAKSDIWRLQEGRRNKIHSMVDAAIEAESRGKLDVALRQLHWAFSLTRSMQFSNEEEYGGQLLINWIPLKMSEILSDISVSVANVDDEGLVTLAFMYKGRPVNSLDFTYNDGGMWSTICSAKNGFGKIETFPGDVGTTYDLLIETEFKSQASYDPEIQNVLELAPEYTYREAYISVDRTPVSVPEVQQTVQLVATQSLGERTAASTFTTLAAEDIAAPPTASDSLTARYGRVLRSIESAIRSGSSVDVQQYLTPEAYQIYRQLLRYGRASVIGTPDYTFSQFSGKTWARGLNMTFRFRHGARRTFTEDVVFTFDDSTGLISNIAFGLGDTTTADILTNSHIPDAARMLLTDFIENYQTAFALKRLDYISSIFHENALIIVVNKLQNVVTGNVETGLSVHPNYQRIRMDKDKYIERLDRQFRTKEFINLRFNSTNLVQSPIDSNVYGLQIEQDYYSSNYCDHGYLFLTLNMRDPERPLILVRTWQPEPDPEFGIYSLDDFPIQRNDSIQGNK